MDGLLGISQTATGNLGEVDNLVRCLAESKLGSSDRTSVDELELNLRLLRLLILRFVLNYACYEFSNGRGKSAQQDGVDGVEKSVKHRSSVEYGRRVSLAKVCSAVIDRQGVGQTKGLDNQAHELKERSEEDQCPAHPEEVEDRMCQSCTAGIGSTNHCGKVGRDGRSDILTQHHCCSHLEGNPAHTKHYECQGHRSTRRLKHKRQDSAYGKENQHRAETILGPAGDKRQHLRSFAQVGHRLLHHRKAEEEQCKTDYKLAHILTTLALGNAQYKT